MDIKNIIKKNNKYNNDNDNDSKKNKKRKKNDKMNKSKNLRQKRFLGYDQDDKDSFDYDSDNTSRKRRRPIDDPIKDLQDRARFAKNKKIPRKIRSVDFDENYKNKDIRLSKNNNERLQWTSFEYKKLAERISTIEKSMIKGKNLSQNILNDDLMSSQYDYYVAELL